MQLIGRVIAFLFTCLSLATPVYGSAKQEFDLVTMKNGDIHHGTVAHENFTLNTVAGSVSIPYLYMSELVADKQSSRIQLFSVWGERLSGEIKADTVLIIRDQEPALPLHLDDISRIEFSPKYIKRRATGAVDGIVLQNGDRFWGRIYLNGLELKSPDAIDKSNLYLLDIERLLDGEVIMSQATYNSGSFNYTEKTASDISVDTVYGQTLKIPVDQVSTFAFKANYQLGQADFNFRQKLNPGQAFRDRLLDGSNGPQMIALRGGAFTRGDIQGNGDSDEQPARVIKPAAFAMGVYEVSFAEYDRFCDDTGYTRPDDGDWGRGHRPVINVSWQDATAYTNWLSRKTRQVYRLPTDAEWEYAARSGSQMRYWWGNDVGSARANCEGCGSLWDGEKTAPVGRFKPNEFGLHDTAGNVFEWVADCYHNTFADAPKDGSAIDKPGCGKRVIRGGAWSFPPKEIRSANRWRDFPTRRSDDTGFRLVRELESTR